jgi:hypothetical protein
MFYQTNTDTTVLLEVILQMFLKIMSRIFLLLLMMNVSLGVSQSVTESLRHHVYYLSDDSLEGRQTGSRGEQMAFRYIINEFEKNGIAPLGSESYLQPFPF